MLNIRGSKKKLQAYVNTCSLCVVSDSLANDHNTPKRGRAQLRPRDGRGNVNPCFRIMILVLKGETPTTSDNTQASDLCQIMQP